jgi:type I restriction enzyme S subunit
VTAGWEAKTLGEVVQLEYGKPLTPSDRNPNGLYPAYGANGVKDRTDRFFRDKPSIIVGRKGSAGEITLTENKYWPLDVTYFVEFDRQRYDLRFLYYLLTALNLPSLSKGVKPGINRNEVYAVPVRVPKLAEQRRIAVILDDVFEDVGTAKANAEKNLQNARDLFASALTKIFSADWPRVRIEDACRSITDCVNKTAPTVSGPTPYKMIRTTNVRNGIVSLASVNYVSKDVYDVWTRRQVPLPGDVILTREAPMGEVGMLESDEHVFLGQRLVSYRTEPSKLHGRFLLYGLQSEPLQRQIHALASGSTVQHMRVPDSKNLQLPLPKLQEQEAAVLTLDAMREETTKLREIYSRKITALVDLKSSLLHQAMSGGLTTKSKVGQLEAVT